MLNYQIISNVGCSCKLHRLVTNSTSNAVLFARGMSSVVMRLGRWRHELSDRATRPTATMLRPMSHLRFYRAILSHECATSSRATKSQTLRLSSCTLRLCRIKAKFHCTDPTRQSPRTLSETRVADKVSAHCRRRAKFHCTDPTRTRPDPHGPARTFLRRNSVGSVRVRSGPCSGI